MRPARAVRLRVVLLDQANNMRGNLLSKRIPTILGILILIGGLIAGIVLVGQRQGFGLRAGPTAVPRNVTISNRSSNGFTVSWTTDVPVTGFVVYSDNPTRLNLPAGDERDQISGTTQQYTTHYVNVTGLTPDKTYYFEIGSGSENYNDGGKPYQVRTAPQAAAPPEDVISGKVVTSTNAPAGGAIVYAEITGAEALSTLTRNDGGWRIALSNARNTTGDFVAYDKATATLTILVQAGTSGTATALTTVANANPVPEITLGKTHNFATGEVAPVITDIGGGGGGNFSSLAVEPTPPEATFSVKLLNPAVEGEALATQTPEFLGTGPAGTVINLTLDVTGQKGVATVSATQNWTWSPPQRLSLGNHTIALSYQEGGNNFSFSRGFVILSAREATVGGLPAFSATPSATPTATATATPSITPTATPTATPTGLPEAGILTPTYSLLILGIGLFVSGVVWKRKLEAEINDQG